MLAARRAADSDGTGCSVPQLPLPTGDARTTKANVPGGPKATLADMHLHK